MHTFRIHMLVIAVLLCGAGLARAQEAQRVEVTPFLALGSNGVSPIGAAITFPLTPTLAIEAEVGYRRGEGDIHALNMNASVLCSLPRLGKITPYVAGGIGLAEYGSPVVLRAGGYPIGAEPRVTLTVNAGGGFKVPVRDTWDLRTDARWFNSFGHDAGEHFRVAQGISFDVRK
jgi:hypothetical protein